MYFWLGINKVSVIISVYCQQFAILQYQWILLEFLDVLIRLLFNLLCTITFIVYYLSKPGRVVMLWILYDRCWRKPGCKHLTLDQWLKLRK